MASPIPRRVVPSARPSPLAPRQVAAEFRRRLAEGAELRPAGTARRDPGRLLARGYEPRHRVKLFDTTFYLAGVRQNEDIRFFPGFVARDPPAGRAPAIYPRLFYKDGSLIWRVASHYARSDRQNWIGKGDVRSFRRGGELFEESVESTTDLPLEVQTAFERLSRRARRIPTDEAALALLLRRAPDDRIQAYHDFREPRRRAQADPANRVHGGRSVAWFQRRGDPRSLRFAAGYQPDLARGVLEVSRSHSRLYGGMLRRFRILSVNRSIQYLFMAGPRQVWIIPPQATTTELSSYGVRTVDVVVDEDLCVPGYEYHLVGEHADSAELFEQIPAGFAGEPSPTDPSRADASRWLEQLPVVRAFRRQVLGDR